jgi:hypothetical protein
MDGNTPVKDFSVDNVIVHQGDVGISIPMRELQEQMDQRYKRARLWHTSNPSHVAEFIIIHRDAPSPPPRLERITRVEVLNRTLTEKGKEGCLAAVLTLQGKRLADVSDWGSLEVFKAQEGNNRPVYSSEMKLVRGEESAVLRERGSAFPDITLSLSAHPVRGSEWCSWKGVVWVNIYTEYDSVDGKNVVTCCYTSNEGPAITFTNNIVNMPGDGMHQRPGYSVSLDFERTKGDGRKIVADGERPKY